jgi:hypothetical protein
MLLFGHDIIEVVLLIIGLSLEYVGIFAGMYYYLYYKPKKLNLVYNNTIQKQNKINFRTKEEYRQHKIDYKKKRAMDKVPEYRNRIICIILRENKFSKILYFSGKQESFTYEKCLYFLLSPHTCDNGAKLLVFLEGISLPLSYDNVQKEQMKKTYIDVDGTEKETIITVIKGLKWDGKILHIFTNRKFAEIFTNIRESPLILMVFILCIVTLVISCIGIGITYFMR